MSSAAGRWVWLRGLSREQRHWGELLPAAREFAEVMAVDLPGTGDCATYTAPCSVEAIADQVRARALHQGLRLPVRLLGLSMGGMVAHAWQQRYPREVQALVLINSSIGGTVPFHRRLNPARYGSVLRALWLPQAKREALIYRLTCTRADAAAQTLTRWNAIQQQHPVSRSTFCRQLIAAACYRPALAAPQCPCWLWLSEADALVEPSCSEALAQRWHVPLLRHPSAGHDLPADDPGWFLRHFAAVDADLPPA